MKSPAFILAVCLSLFTLSLPKAEAGEGLKKGDVVAICGDSITEQKLYSLFIEEYLLMCQPVEAVSAHQFGWSGEKADGFANRMKTEVLPFQPTVATICYGMNDASYTTIDPVRQAAYRKNLETVIGTFKAAGTRFIVVASPTVVDTDNFDKFAKKNILAADYNAGGLADCSKIGREVAQAQGVAYADLRTPMLEVMAKMKAKYGPSWYLAPDGIHPAVVGHMAMAGAILKALGCTGDIGTITIDMATKKATASEGHEVLSFTDGTAELSSTRYPFCFFGESSDPNNTRGILDVLPFNEELNRFQLVVHGLAAAAKWKVTWGEVSKTFAAADLEKGINLAAEFPNNPFSIPFQKAEEAIKAQQAFETPAVKNLLHSLPVGRELLPEQSAAFDQIGAGVVKKDSELTSASKASVAPVKYRLKIEPVAP